MKEDRIYLCHTCYDIGSDKAWGSIPELDTPESFRLLTSESDGCDSVQERANLIQTAFKFDVNLFPNIVKFHIA